MIAKVVYVGPDRSTKINGKNPFMVAWEFSLDGPQRYQGRISAMKPEKLADLAAAPELVVLYLEGDPRLNTVWVA